MILNKLPKEFRKVLLSSDNSRQNKIYLAQGWTTSKYCNYYIEWKWADRPFRSRLYFKFEEDGEYFKAKSFEEDIFIHFLSDEPRKKEHIKKQ